MVLNEPLVVLLVLNQVVGQAVRDGQVSVVLEEDHLVGRGAGARPERAYVDVLDIGIGDLARHHARVQHRMRFGHVRAPGDEHVGVVDVGVAAGRLVGLEDVHEAHDGAGHAQARVRVDVVGKQARLPELRRDIPLGDGLLAGSPIGQTALVGFPGLAELGSHQVEGLGPRGLAEALVRPLQGVVIADQRLGQTVLTVQDLAEVVSLHAVQAAVGIVLGIAVNADDLAFQRLDDNAAPASAETADGKRLGHRLAVERLVHFWCAACHPGYGAGCSCGGHGNGRRFDEVTP